MQEICDSDLDNKQEFLIAPYFFFFNTYCVYLGIGHTDLGIDWFTVTPGDHCSLGWLQISCKEV